MFLRYEYPLNRKLTDKEIFKRAIILEGKTIRYDNWRQKNMPVDGPSYLVGRTDEKVLTMFWSSIVPY